VASIMESASASHLPLGVSIVERYWAAFSAISLSTFLILGSSLAISSFIFCKPVGSLALRKGVYSSVSCMELRSGVMSPLKALSRSFPQC